MYFIGVLLEIIFESTIIAAKKDFQTSFLESSLSAKWYLHYQIRLCKVLPKSIPFSPPLSLASPSLRWVRSVCWPWASPPATACTSWSGVPSTSATGKENSILRSIALVLGSQGCPRNILHKTRVYFFLLTRLRKREKHLGYGPKVRLCHMTHEVISTGHWDHLLGSSVNWA